jgi:maltooligosyltrehalose synthase
LPEGSWIDTFTGFSASGSVPLSDLLSRYPVALLLAT